MGQARTDKPGKLRLMYRPTRWPSLIEQGRRRDHNGTQRIMDIQPTQLHERVQRDPGARATKFRRVTRYHLEDAERKDFGPDLSGL